MLATRGATTRTCPAVFARYRGFTMIFFSVGSHEALLSDTLTIVDKLKAVGKEPTLEIEEEMFRAYITNLLQKQIARLKICLSSSQNSCQTDTSKTYGGQDLSAADHFRSPESDDRLFLL